MNEATGLSSSNCQNGGCEGCDCRSGGEPAELTAQPTREQISLLQRTTGVHTSRSGKPYRNSLRCAEASRQYGQAIALCEMGLMARVGGTPDPDASNGVAAVARFEVTNAGARVLGVGSARELTHSEE